MITAWSIQEEARRRETARAAHRRDDEAAGLAYQFTHTTWTFPRTRAL